MIPLHSFRRGEQITADQLNVILDSIRRNTLTDGSGYTLNRTPYGTSLRINQSVATGGGGGGGTVCKWRVEDISEPSENGKLHLKIRIYVDELKDVNQWPNGTSAEQPYFDIDINDRTYTWSGVYLRIEVDQKNVPLDNEYGIVITESGKWEKESSIVQITYIAGVTISEDTEGNPYISYIDNYCPSPYVKPAPVCPFLIEDYGLNAGANQYISIRSTTIERHYPTGMNGVDTYVLTIPDTQQWWAVYAVIVTNSDGDIQFGENDITLSLQSTYKESTETLTYFLLGEVNTGYDANSERVIDCIYNTCQAPFITGAITDTGTIISRGRTPNCPFRVTDESIEGTVRVKVQHHTVNTPSARWPQGMGPGNPDYYIPIAETLYIYVKIIYVANEVIVGPDPSDILIVVFPNIVENLVDWEFVLLAVVEYDGSKITKITNSCQNVTANPCNLKWS